MARNDEKIALTTRIMTRAQMVQELQVVSCGKRKVCEFLNSSNCKRGKIERFNCHRVDYKMADCNRGKIASCELSKIWALTLLDF